MFECRRCGGEMIAKSYDEYAVQSLAIAKGIYKYNPPRHKKRRIQKKLRKRYDVEYNRKVALTAMIGVPLMRGPIGSYRCTKCGNAEGGYGFIARQIFKVEPMPQGALPYYSRDPEVAETVTRDVSDEEKQEIIRRALQTPRK